MKIISAFILTLTASLVPSESSAHDQNRHQPGYDRRYVQHGASRTNNTSAAVAIGVGALVLGTIIATNRNNRIDNSYYPYYPGDRQVCDTIENRDHYGNLMNRRTVCYYPR